MDQKPTSSLDMYAFTGSTGSTKSAGSKRSNPSGATSDDEWQPSEDSSKPTCSQSGQGEVSTDSTTSINGANADLSSIRLPSISPLPELMVEREINRHDEPTEFYSWLLQRVRWRYLRELRRAGDALCSSLESTWDTDSGRSVEIFRNSGRGDEQGCELEIVSHPACTDGDGDGDGDGDDGDTGGAQHNGTPSAPASIVSDRSVAEGTQATSGSEAEGQRPLQHVAMEMDDGERADNETQDVSQFEQAHQQQELENKENYKELTRRWRRGTYSSPSLTSPTLSSIRSKNVYSEDSGASCKAKTHQVEKIQLLEPRSTEHFKSLSLVSEKPSLVQTLMENVNVERVRCAKFSRPPVIVAFQSPVDAEKSNKNVSPQSDRNSSSNRQSGSSDTHLSYSSEPHSFGEPSSPSSHEQPSYETPQQPRAFIKLSTITEEATSDLSGKTSQSKRKAHVSDIGDSACSKRSKTMTTKKHISKNVMEDEIISSSNTFGNVCEEIPDDNSRPLRESTPQDINVEKLTAEKSCSNEPEIMREDTQKQISHSPIIVRKSSESSISPIVSMTSQKQRFSLCDSNVTIHLSKNAEIDVTEGAYMVERMESDVDEVGSEYCVRSDEKYDDKNLQNSLQSTAENEIDTAVGEIHQRHHVAVQVNLIEDNEEETPVGEIHQRHHVAVQVNLTEDNEEETPVTLKEVSTQTRHSKGDQSFILRSTDINKQYKKTKATQVTKGVKTSAQKSGGIDKGVQFNLRVDASTQTNFGKNKIVQVNFGIDKAVNTDFGINKCVQVCIGIDKCEQVSMYGEPSDKYG